MVTGDLQGNVARLQRELKQIKYPGLVDEVGLRLGDPVALLPLLHFTLLRFSRHVAQCIARAGYEIQGKADQRFVETAFRLFRDCLGVPTVLTPSQFLQQGYAERKVMLLCDVMQVCKKMHNDEIRKERLAALKSRPGTVSNMGAQESISRTLEVKVVKGGQETRQIVSPVHLPNATGGGQSVYAVRKQTSSPLMSMNRGAPEVVPVTPASSNRRGSVSAASPPASAASAQGPHRMPAAYHRGGVTQHPHAPTLEAAAAQDLWPASQPPTASQAWLPQQQQQQQQDSAAWMLGPGYASSLSATLQPWLQAAQQQQQPHDVAPNPDTYASALPSQLSFQPALIHSWFMNPAFSDNLDVPSLQPRATDRPTGLTAGISSAPPADNSLRTSLHDDDPWLSAAGMQSSRGAWLSTGPPSAQDQGQGACQPALGQQRQDTDLPSRAQPHGDGLQGTGFQPDLDAWHPSRSPTQFREAGRPAAAAHGTQPGASTTTSTQQGGSGRLAHAPWPAHPVPHSLEPSVEAEIKESPLKAQLREQQQQLEALSLQLTARLQECSQRLESAEQELQSSKREAHEAKESLQARATVLEGRVRFLECELSMCIRVGEYVPSRLPQHDQDLRDSPAGPGSSPVPAEPTGSAARTQPSPGYGAQRGSSEGPSTEAPGASSAQYQLPQVHAAGAWPDEAPSRWSSSPQEQHDARGTASSQQWAMPPAPAAGHSASVGWAGKAQSLGLASSTGGAGAGAGLVSKLGAPTPSFGFQPSTWMQSSLDSAAPAAALPTPKLAPASHGGSSHTHTHARSQTPGLQPEEQQAAEPAWRQDLHTPWPQDSAASSQDQGRAVRYGYEALKPGPTPGAAAGPGSAAPLDPRPRPGSSAPHAPPEPNPDQDSSSGAATSALINTLIQRYTDAHQFMLDLRQSR